MRIMWLLMVGILAESPPEVPEEPTAGEIGEEEVAESISEWLAKISPEEALESIAEGSESLSTVSSEEETSLVQAEIPQWLREMESASPVESTVPAESVMEELSPMASEDFSLEAGEIPDWLKVAMAADAIEHVVEPGVVEHELTGQPIIEGDTQPVRVRITEVEPSTDVGGEIAPVESELIVEKTIAEEIVLEQTLKPSQETIYNT